VAQEGYGFPRQGTVCTDTGAKPAQIALAWLMQKKGVTAPIASDQPLPT
jgi:aryl-alcohol dehydrogenase-like predicted oxidoreductase